MDPFIHIEAILRKINLRGIDKEVQSICQWVEQREEFKNLLPPVTVLPEPTNFGGFCLVISALLYQKLLLAGISDADLQILISKRGHVFLGYKDGCIIIDPSYQQAKQFAIEGQHAIIPVQSDLKEQWNILIFHASTKTTSSLYDKKASDGQLLIEPMEEEDLNNLAFTIKIQHLIPQDSCFIYLGSRGQRDANYTSDLEYVIVLSTDLSESEKTKIRARIRDSTTWHIDRGFIGTLADFTKQFGGNDLLQDPGVFTGNKQLYCKFCQQLFFHYQEAKNRPNIQDDIKDYSFFKWEINKLFFYCTEDKFMTARGKSTLYRLRKLFTIAELAESPEIHVKNLLEYRALTYKQKRGENLTEEELPQWGKLNNKFTNILKQLENKIKK